MKNVKRKKRPLRVLIFIFIIILILLISIFLYSYFIGTSGFKIKEYNIKNKNIADEFYGLKIVQISDIHYGFHFNKKKLENIVKRINDIKPDIVVLTGDLVDKNISNEKADELKEILSRINVTIGKYIIMGNHDYKYKNWKNIIENTGFIDLNDNYEIIYGNNSSIMISGVSTNLYNNNDINNKLESSKKYLENNKIDYKILLIHEPDYIDNIKDISYDLILAGHSHNGQVRFPFIGAIYKPNGSKKYYEDYYKVNNSDIYISSGLGTSIMNLRLFNKPSINFFRLTN